MSSPQWRFADFRLDPDNACLWRGTQSLALSCCLLGSRLRENPGGARHGDWMPAYAGMTFYWCRTYETDI